MRTKMKRMMEKTKGLMLVLMLLTVPTLVFRAASASAAQPATLRSRWAYDATWLSENAYVSGNITQLVIGINKSRPNSYGQLLQFQASKGGKAVDTISIRGEKRALVVETSLDRARQLMMDIESTGLAEYVEPNFMCHADIVPNDPNWTVQWGPAKIGADWAWNYTQGGSSVLVAVVDTGIDYEHPDLAANYVPLGYDWVNNHNDPRDDNGHGTHCAGIIAAELNNSVGIAGVAQAHLMAEKVLAGDGTGTDVSVANGIINATNAGAKIISMSLGLYFNSELVHQAIEEAYDDGVLLIAAAGNDNTFEKLYPAAYDEVIAVSATNQSDQKSSFSNYGKWVELAAPGSSIYSTMPHYNVTLNGDPYYRALNYDYLSGTSMACPHVAGVAALVWSKYHNMSRDAVRHWLRCSADDLGVVGFDRYYGYGRTDALKAVQPYQHDYDPMALDLEVPPYLKANSLSTVTGVVLGFGEEDTANVTTLLYDNATLVGNSTRSLLGSGDLWSVDVPWTPTVGVHNLTLRVECNTDQNGTNNVFSRIVTARYPTTLFVPGDYQSAQQAVDEAIAGDIINASGYSSRLDLSDKSNIALAGSSGADIEGVYIVGHNITIAGFSIYDLYVPPDPDFPDLSRSAVEIHDSSNINISGNYIARSPNGIVADSTQKLVIRDNSIRNNRYGGIFGLYVSESHIDNNYISADDDQWVSALEGYRLGLQLSDSNSNSIVGNTIAYYNTSRHTGHPPPGPSDEFYNGLVLANCANNIVEHNDVKQNDIGAIVVESLSANEIRENNFTANYLAIIITGSNNGFYHNNFLGNSHSVALPEIGPNAWDDGYPGGGNYWSDYNGSDSKWGPQQNRAGCDSIGDTQRTIGANNIDRYPLMTAWTPGTHDIAVTNLSASETVAQANETIRMNATVSNLGDGTHTIFNETCHLLVYRGTQIIQNITGIALTEGANYTTYFNWTTPDAPGNYTIVAEASTVAGESDVANNNRNVTVTVQGEPTYVRLVVKVPQAPPEGVTIWVDGNAYTAYANTPVNISIAIGQHTLQAQYAFMKEEVEPGTYYVYFFDSWSDGYTDNPRNISITADTTLEAWYWRDGTGIERMEPA